MMQFLFFFLLMLNSYLFLIMNHPLSMGLILMTQTLLMALFTGNFTFMFWFSYSLFLIFMGGMLILFMYMTSLASNETFKFSLNFKFFYIMSIILIMFLTMIFQDTKTLNFINSNIMNNETNSMTNLSQLMEKNIMLLIKLFNPPTNLITILMINYLFLTLIATVKITDIFKGPLRQKNY